jgi:hypothetical protein
MHTYYIHVYMYICTHTQKIYDIQTLSLSLTYTYTYTHANSLMHGIRTNSYMIKTKSLPRCCQACGAMMYIHTHIHVYTYTHQAVVYLHIRIYTSNARCSYTQLHDQDKVASALLSQLRNDDEECDGYTQGPN